MDGAILVVSAADGPIPQDSRTHFVGAPSRRSGDCRFLEQNRYG